MAIHARFRKTFTLIPHLLQCNISKGGMSLTFRLGPLKRTVGTAGSSTSLDAPGHLGLSFQDRHRESHSAAATKRGEVVGGLEALVAYFVTVVLSIVLLARTEIRPNKCVVSGRPLHDLLIVLGCQIAFTFAARWLPGGRRAPRILWALVGAGLAWVAFGHFAIAGHARCGW
jgi:hypothetical protein